MKSIPKGADIGLSMIPRPKEGGFIYGRGYDADSAFTSNGANRSWNTNLENLDVQPDGAQNVRDLPKSIRCLTLDTASESILTAHREPKKKRQKGSLGTSLRFPLIESILLPRLTGELPTSLANTCLPWACQHQMEPFCTTTEFG